jgi:hypothetical protein
MGQTEPPKELNVANIIRSVQRYLSDDLSHGTHSLPTFALAAHLLVAAWNEMLSTVDTYTDTSEPDDEPQWERLRELETQIENARPDDLVGLAMQCRYLEHSLSSGSDGTQVVLSGWIAAALARLAGVEYVA